MGDQPQPLTPGEHVDLDSGVTVRRFGTKDSYRVINAEEGVTLDREDVRDLAALAGFNVTDPLDGDFD